MNIKLLDYNKHKFDDYVLAILSIISIIPMWLVDYMPMVDMPQHAAQIQVLLNYSNPDANYHELFRLNYFTPYLTGYGALYFFSLFVDISTASKLLLSCSFLATVYLSRTLLQVYGSDKNLALLVVPVNYGFAYYLGFFTFVFSIPLLLLFLFLVNDYLNKPSLRKGILLGLLSIILFFSHFMIFGVAILIATVQTFVKYGIKHFLIYTPYLTALPLVLTWAVQTAANEPYASKWLWSFDAKRIPGLFSHTIGMYDDVLFVVLGAILFAIPFLLNGRITKSSWKLVPFLTIFIIYAAFPTLIANIVATSGRFTILLFIFYLLLFEFRTRPNRLQLVGATIFSAILVVMTITRFVGFNQETAGFKDMINSMPEGKTALSMVFKTKSNYFGGQPVYLHFPLWYEAEKTGVVDFNFALLYPPVVRYRENKLPKIRNGFEVNPGVFNWIKHGGDDYDYFIVRSERNITVPLFREHVSDIRLIEHAGTWWLYENI
ncbi:hypothetical protein [Kaarinaea lacus]